MFGCLVVVVELLVVVLLLFLLSLVDVVWVGVVVDGMLMRGGELGGEGVCRRSWRQWLSGAAMIAYAIPARLRPSPRRLTRAGLRDIGSGRGLLRRRRFARGGKSDEGHLSTLVSSEQQKEENTIASQTSALIEFARDSDTAYLMSGSSKTRDLASPAYCCRVWSCCAILPPRVTFRLSLYTRRTG